jgi:hypothetical protein
MPQTITSRNYLYGLSLSSSYPFALTGSPDTSTVALPASSRIVLRATNTIGGLTSTASTQIEIVGSNIPTIYQTTIGKTASGYKVYQSSNLFNYSSIYSVSPSTLILFDILKVGVDGSRKYIMTSGSSDILQITQNNVVNILTAAGTNFLQLAKYSDSVWYALGVNFGNLYVYITRDPDLWDGSYAANITNFDSGRTTDGGYVMKVYGVYILFSGSSGIYYLFYFLPNNLSLKTPTKTSCTLTNVNAISTTGPIAVAVGTPPTSGSSIQYCSGSPANWSNAIGGFSGAGTNVVYGGPVSPIWLATGSNDLNVSIKYSTDAINWADSITFPIGTVIGPMNFAGTNWSVFVYLSTSYAVYQHDILTSTFSDSTTWFTTPATFDGTIPTALYTFPDANILPTGIPILLVNSGATSTGGPTFVSPTTTNYVMYQYVPISIVVDAGAGASYFVDTTTLPHGMTWTTNISTGSPGRYTALLSGASVQLGTFPITIYAQLGTAVSTLTLSLNVNRLFPTTDHRSAAAYTAFTREKVVADAATSSVNNRVLPTAVGPFLLDTPPYVPAVSSNSFISPGTSSVARGLTLLPATGNSSSACFIKYNTSGLAVFSITIPSSSLLVGISSDSSGIFMQGTCTSYYPIVLKNGDSTYSSISIPKGSTSTANTPGQASFIVKSDLNGNILWANTIIGGNQYTYALANNSTRVYVSGVSQTTGTTPISLNNGFSLPIGYWSYIICFDTSGKVLQVIVFPNQALVIESMTISSTGGLYASGYYQSANAISLTNADGTDSGQSFPATLGSGGNYDIFIINYNTNGQVVWSTTIRNDVYATYSRMGSVIDSGALYIGAHYASSSVIQLKNASGENSGKTLPATGPPSPPAPAVVIPVVIKYDIATGMLIWATSISASGGVYAATVVSTSLYVGGSYKATNAIPLTNADGTVSSKSLQSTGGSAYAFVVKYKADGTVVWATSYNIVNSQVFGLAGTLDGGIYASGRYSVSSDYNLLNADGSISTKFLPKTTTASSFLIKYDSDGFVQWVSSILSPTGLIVTVALSSDSKSIYAGCQYASAATIQLPTGI